MSDPKSYGEPVEEPTPVDDVVGRANEGLAEAEAARSDAVVDEPAPAETATVSDAAEQTPVAEPVEPPADTVEPVATPEPDPWDSEEAAALEYEKAPAPEPLVETPVAEPAEPVAPAAAAAAPVVTPSEPVVDPTAETTAYPSYEAPVIAAAAAAPQPIFVQAPEAPTPRGNRAAVGAIGLLAALSFAVLYFAAWLGFAALKGDVDASNVATVALEALATWALWVPVVVFYIAFWLLGAIINRGRWGAWVIFGIFVGIASYGGYILGQLFQAPFWMITASEGAALVEEQWLAPLAIASFVIGRELTIWFGTWAAARGKRVTELNIEAQREYERTLEAGPQLVRQ
ncbi:ABC transporter [Microbacterium sp. 2FI]|uniref:ABC transporter n=1 Tax=Microbacterium sp. 2FI TaxID=2502193 RepID=UPI0010FA16CC|nr:ABC transporter [Microbacterium sp. 2FI]